MKDFETYYHNRFQRDLDRFFETIPEGSKFHEDREEKQIYSVQYHRLTNEYGHLSFLDKEERELFGVALYFTILIDMVCYTHFQKVYAEFQKITRYPKFIGDCPGACHLHYHPREVFTAMNRGIDISSNDRMDFYGTIKESIPLFKQEIRRLFKDQLNEIDGNEFWIKCKQELPY